MRLVLDTNVLVAAFVARGTCHELLNHCERAHVIVASEFILGEFETKLLGKFKVPPEKAADVLSLIRVHMEVVEPPALDEPACRDPDDDWILATALAGECACIVTGDKDLLSLGSYSEIPIIAPGEFWAFEASGRSQGD